MPPKKNTKNTTTTTRKKPTAKRTRNTTNANAAHPRPQPPRPSQVLRNMITLNAIPNGRVFMLGKEGSVKQPYDVHGLANMVHHDTRGRLTNLGRPAPREPHTREEISQRTINAIMKHAKNTGWVRPSAESTMTVTANNRRVPANLAATAAVERAARNATLGRQRAASRQIRNIRSSDNATLRTVVRGMQHFEQLYRDIARDVGSLFRNQDFLQQLGVPGHGQLGAQYVEAALHYVQAATESDPNYPMFAGIRNVFTNADQTKLSIQYVFAPGFPSIIFVSHVKRTGLFLVEVIVGGAISLLPFPGLTLNLEGGIFGARFAWEYLHNWTPILHYERFQHPRDINQAAVFLNQALLALGVRPVEFEF